MAGASGVYGEGFLFFGKASLVVAGAVVTRDMDLFSVVAGIPAVKIREDRE